MHPRSHSQHQEGIIRCLLERVVLAKRTWFRWYITVSGYERFAGHILIAWLSEEEWSVPSFLDLLLCVFQACKKNLK
jgi:hypothetical protein